MESDRAAVERQLGRPPRAFRRVVVRCPSGHPAVTEQAPFDDAGEPFPTTYWITCPQLVAAISRVEAAGGVERWTQKAAGDPSLTASLERGHAEQRALRPELDLGIGGARLDAKTLKCLHAHVAFALARPGYELGERIVAPPVVSPTSSSRRRSESRRSALRSRCDRTRACCSHSRRSRPHSGRWGRTDRRCR